MDRTHFKMTILEPPAVKKFVWTPPVKKKKKKVRKRFVIPPPKKEKEEPIVSEIMRDGSWSIGLPKDLKLPPGVEKLGGGSDVVPEPVKASAADSKTKGRLLLITPIVIGLIIDERTLDYEEFQKPEEKLDFSYTWKVLSFNRKKNSIRIALKFTKPGHISFRFPDYATITICGENAVCRT
jgi:hypothetical protein